MVTAVVTVVIAVITIVFAFPVPEPGKRGFVGGILWPSEPLSPLSPVQGAN